MVQNMEKRYAGQFFLSYSFINMVRVKNNSDERCKAGEPN